MLNILIPMTENPGGYMVGGLAPGVQGLSDCTGMACDMKAICDGENWVILKEKFQKNYPS